MHVFLDHNFTLCFLCLLVCAAKPQTSLRQPNHRGRGGSRGGGGGGRGGGHGDFRQAREMRDGQSESKTGAHPNKLSNQSATNRKGNPPGEKWVRGMKRIFPRFSIFMGFCSTAAWGRHYLEFLCTEKIGLVESVKGTCSQRFLCLLLQYISFFIYTAVHLF